MGLLLMVGLSLPLYPAQTWAAGATKLEELSPEQRAKLGGLLKSAKSAFEEGNYEAAAGHLEEAYEIYAQPNILYRLAETYEKLGETRKAIDAYRQYVLANPTGKDLAKVEAHIDELKASAVGTLKLTSSPSGAMVYLNTSTEAAGKTPVELKLSPGNYEVIFRKEGYKPARQTIEVVARERLRISQGMLREVDSDGGSGDLLFWASAGTTGAMLALSATTLILSRLANSDLEAIDAQRGDQPRPADYNDQVRSYNSLVITSWVSGGLALAAGGFTALLWTGMLSGSRDESAALSSPWVSIGQGSAQLGWRLTF